MLSNKGNRMSAKSVGKGVSKEEQKEKEVRSSSSPSPSLPSLSLSAPSPSPSSSRRVGSLCRQMTSSSSLRAENALFNEEVKHIESFFKQERFRYTKRPYTADQVARLRGTLYSRMGGACPYPSSYMARKVNTSCTATA